MGLLDNLAKTLKKEVENAATGILKDAVKDAKKAINTKTEKFTFSAIPGSLAELKSLPESSLDTPFKTAALAIAVLANYNKDKEATIEMMDFLKGPENVSAYEKQFYHDRLADHEYLMFSFFEGATVANGYTPTKPFTIKVSDNPYSYPEANWATLYVSSAGADSPRAIKLRKKPSTGQWFVNEVLCLGEIRMPAEIDPWA